jgi:acetolactate synthase-1/2/3 large subunit
MPTAAEAVVKSLSDNGINYAYGIPAVHNLPLYDALYDSPSVRSVSVKHEQAAGFMAIGSAYSSGKLAACFVGCGPGATNVLTPVAEAYLDSVPLIVIAGGIRTVSAGKGALHDVDQVSLFKAVTKQASRLTDPKSLGVEVSKAIEVAANGRPRPVFLEIPFDVLSAQIEEITTKVSRIASSTLNNDSMSSILKILEQSSKPLIIAGGGVNSAQAWNELSKLAELLHSPVASTISAKGAFPETNPLSLGQIWSEVASKAASQADVVLSLGCRFSERSTTNWRLHFNGSLIQVDIDQNELGRNYPYSVGVLSDVKLFLQELLARLHKQNTVERDAWIGTLNQEKMLSEKKNEKYDSLSAKQVRPQTLIREIQRAISEDTIVVAETGYAFWWSALLLKIDKPRSYLAPSGNSTLGFGFPAAMGAKCAKPDRPVICLAGDGGFTFSCQELATAIEEKISVVTVIFDDSGYAAIRDFQRKGYGGRLIGVDFQNQLNFVKMAESLGAEGILVTKEDEVYGAVKNSIQSSKTVIIDVKIGRDEDVLPSFFTQIYRKS